MGVSTGLLALRGVEYSPGNSGILHNLSPLTWSESIGSSTNANSNVWASKTDKCSLVLIFLIIYSTVVSTFDLTVRWILQCNFNSFHISMFSSAILPSFHQLPHSIVLLPSPAGCDRGPHKRWGKIHPWKTLQEQICPISWGLFNGYLHATWQCAKNCHTSCTTWAGNCLFFVINNKIKHACRTS